MALAAGASELADGTGELAAGTSELAEGTGELAEGTGELPDALDEVVGTADRAGQREAVTAAVLDEGARLATATTGPDGSLTTVLSAPGQDPVAWQSFALVAALVAFVALAGVGGLAVWRRRDRAAADDRSEDNVPDATRWTR